MFYLIASQITNELAMSWYLMLVTGSVVVFVTQVSSPCTSSWSRNKGAWALLYLRQVSMHWTESIALNRTRALSSTLNQPLVLDVKHWRLTIPLTKFLRSY